MSFPRLFLQ